MILLRPLLGNVQSEAVIQPLDVDSTEIPPKNGTEGKEEKGRTRRRQSQKIRILFGRRVHRVAHTLPAQKLKLCSATTTSRSLVQYTAAMI